MSIFQPVIQLLVRGGPAIAPLLVMAVMAVGLMLDRGRVLGRLSRLPDDVVARFDARPLDWQALERDLRSLGSQHAVAGFLLAVLAVRDQPVWYRESRTQEAVSDLEGELTRGLWLLETLVTAAPLVGLLGTITGMMGSFRLLGSAGQVDPMGVSAGVGEALIATAVGLVVALVALFGYNLASRRHARLMDRMEVLASRILDEARLESEASSGPGLATGALS
ncbi:MAG: MotA/TolQ/ExbB proton channel family protein [bacterium]|nr:MotA/TolQ/ExbB proton channel family protein [bacterium]